MVMQTGNRLMHANLARVEQFLLRLQDPYNKSSIAIYVNPLMKKMVQGEPTKLCTNEFLATYQMTNHASRKPTIERRYSLSFWPLSLCCHREEPKMPLWVDGKQTVGGHLAASFPTPEALGQGVRRATATKMSFILLDPVAHQIHTQESRCGSKGILTRNRNVRI